MNRNQGVEFATHAPLLTPVVLRHPRRGAQGCRWRLTNYELHVGKPFDSSHGRLLAVPFLVIARSKETVGLPLVSFRPSGR